MITVIPAIDIINGECVRLTQGDYGRKTTYFKEPLDVAKRYEDMGATRLHMVDLDGAKAAMPMNLRTLEKVAGKTSLEVQYGGGIKSGEWLAEVFGCGAKRAICGSIAIKSPELFAGWLELFGAEKIVLGADVKDGKIAINGWLECAEKSVEELLEEFAGFGLTQAICTDISKDGMLQGPTFGLYTALQERYPAMDITVSGGISSAADIYRLNEMGLKSVIVGKAIYEGRITDKELEKMFSEK